MAKVSAAVKFDGPFFRNDPSETFLRNVERMMAEIAEQGERAARSALASGQGSRAPLSTGGHLSENVFGRVRGRVGWRRWAAVSPYEPSHSKEEAVAIMAAAAEVEAKTHVFRNVAKGMRAEVKAERELLEGIA